MKTSPSLAVCLAIVSVLLIWTGVRHTRGLPFLPGSAGSAVGLSDNGGEGSGSSSSSSSKVKLRFFRNPSEIPGFSATDLDGRPVPTGRGKVTIVNFWATWCSPCRAEIPDLVALQEKYRDHLQIIGVSEDESPVEEVRRFVAANQMNYPVVMTTKEIRERFPGVYALPTSFILDRQGRLVQKHVGMISAEISELETRALAGLTVNAAIEQVDQTQGLKLDNGAQLVEIPGVDLAALAPQKRTEALKKLNGQSCTCGCDLTVAKCRVDDPTCGVSLPVARQIVQQVASQP
jgi:thiol-disulfide isomerase/thioredoxin